MMGYNEAFDELVRKPFHNLPDFVRFKQDHPDYTTQQYNKFYQNSREALGTGPYNAEEKVVRYCYFQQPLHYSAFKFLAAKRRRTFETKIYSNSGDVLMIDFGCGPMTSCLALAEKFAEYQGGLNEEAEYDDTLKVQDTKLKICYIGIDTERHMIAKAQQFAERTDIFATGSNFQFVGDCLQLDAANLENVISPSGTVIFNFSYIIGQNSISEAVLIKWSEFIRIIRSKHPAASAYLTYLNEGRETYNQRYTFLKQKLGLPATTLESQEYHYRTTNGYTRPGRLVCELVSL